MSLFFPTRDSGNLDIYSAGRKKEPKIIRVPWVRVHATYGPLLLANSDDVKFLFSPLSEVLVLVVLVIRPLCRKWG